MRMPPWVKRGSTILCLLCWLISRFSGMHLAWVSCLKHATTFFSISIWDQLLRKIPTHNTQGFCCLQNWRPFLDHCLKASARNNVEQLLCLQQSKQKSNCLNLYFAVFPAKKYWWNSNLCLGYPTRQKGQKEHLYSLPGSVLEKLQPANRNETSLWGVCMFTCKSIPTPKCFSYKGEHAYMCRSQHERESTHGGETSGNNKKNHQQLLCLKQIQFSRKHKKTQKSQRMPKQTNFWHPFRS